MNIKILNLYLVSLLVFITIPGYASKEKIILVNDTYSQVSQHNLIQGELAYTKKNISRLQNLIKLENEARAKEVLNYWLLLLKKNKVKKSEIESAINNTSSGYISKNLRSLWVNIAGARKDYNSVLEHYPLLIKPVNENDCYYALAKHQNGEINELKGLINDSWINNYYPGEGCRKAHSLLVDLNLVSTSQLSKRLEQDVYRRLKTEFKLINNINFPPGITENDLFSKRKKIPNLLAKILTKNTPQPQIPKLQKPLVLATIGLIAEDEDLAENFFNQYQQFFTKRSKEIVCSYLTHKFSQDFKIQALKYYNCASADIASVLLDKQIETIIRYFIRKEKFLIAKKLINSLTAEKQNKSSWIYWRARIALNQEGANLSVNDFNQIVNQSKKYDNKNIIEAVKALKKISSRTDFYGALANEHFGSSPEIPDFTIPSTQLEINEIANKPCFQWTSFLMSIGGEIRKLGTFEWIDCVQRLLTTDREKLAASRYALSQNIFDRAINTAILTENEHDWRLRFITPFKTEINKAAKDQNIPIELIYGLIRQESRFIIDARSVSGAIGLMQIMPKTGAWLAKQLKFKPYSKSKLEDTNTNVYFGTSYIRMILNKTNHPILMCASYNAGPSRATKWMRNQDYIDPISYIESIPFKETRNYVKNVLWNATIYRIIMGNPKAKVSDWLDPITSENVKSNKHLP